MFVVSAELVGAVEKRHSLCFIIKVVSLSDGEQNLSEAVIGVDLFSRLIESFYQQRRRQSRILEQLREIHLSHVVGLKLRDFVQDSFWSALLQKGRDSGRSRESRRALQLQQ